MNGRYVVLVTASAAAAMLAACGSGGARQGSSSAGTPAPLASPHAARTVQDVYANMLAAIARPGLVLHTTMTATAERAEGYETTQLWLDGARGIARREMSDTGEQPTRDIMDAKQDVEGGAGGSAHSPFVCRDTASPLLSALFACRNALERTTTRLGSARTYERRTVVQLVTEGTVSDADTTEDFKNNSYIDASTWLPVAAETSITPRAGSDYPSLTISTTYTHEFIRVESLAKDFFDPTAIGYASKDPAANLAQDVGVQIYWLGHEFDPNAPALPKLTLRIAGANAGAAAAPIPMYRASLSYAPADDPFGKPLVGMQEWRRSDFEDFLAQSTGGNWWDDLGVTREEITLPTGTMTLFHGHGGTGGQTFDRYLAHVYIGDTMVILTDFDAPSPYNNRDAMVAVARALQPYNMPPG